MRPLLLGFMTVIGPLLLGAGAGRGLRLLVGEQHRRRLVPPFAAFVALSPLGVGHLLPLGIYDLLLMSLCFAATFYSAGRAGLRAPIPPAGVAVAALILVVGLAGAEVLARRVGPAERHLHSPGELHIIFENTEMDFSCQAISSAARAIAPKARAGVRRTLYLGDSMVAAYDVSREERFTALIQAERPNEDHQPFGTTGVGPDIYYYLVRRSVPAFAPDQVLVFLFLGNDFFDMDQRHACCGHERILDYPGGTAVLRCTSVGQSTSLRQKFRMGPAPYLLRVLAWNSALAYTLSSGFERVTQQAKPWVYTDWVPTTEQLDHGLAAIVAIRDELARQRVAFKLVLLPPRWTLERHDPGDPFRPMHERVLQDTRAAGIRVFDCWDLFQDALDRDPKSDYFQREPNNPHFGVAGHRLLARWLLDDVLDR